VLQWKLVDCVKLEQVYITNQHFLEPSLHKFNIHYGRTLWKKSNMTSEGNVADTGILKEAQQLMQDGSATSMGEALKILMENAERNNDNVKIQKIKATQKAKRKRRSRHR